MKGFILKINRAKNEDLVVKILTSKSIIVGYRFYGARHSILQLGYLIDFEIEQDKANFLPRIRSISHIGFPWLYDRQKLFIWHQYIGMFSSHFHDVGDIDIFYYDKLLEIAKKWEKQSSYRLIVESFVDILKFEGRLHNIDRCMICSQRIEDENINLIKGFLPTHTHCSNSFLISKKEAEELFKFSSTLNLNDEIVEGLYKIVLKGTGI